jgi:protein-disulfide isomerase
MKPYEAGLNRCVGGAVLLLSAALSFAGTPLSSADPPVAMIDGKPVLASELLAASQGPLLNLRKQEYDIKRRALDSVIEQKLLEAEAARRGMSVTDLTQREMDIKVGEPTDAEVEAFYLARPDQAQRRFEDVREQMRNSLKAAKRNAARDALMSKLRAQHGVEVLLESTRIEVASDSGRLNGSPDAPVRIVEFSDFECPYCRSAEKTIQAVLAKYPGKVTLAYRDFPLSSIHPSAQGAAEASRCAADQGKYWSYHDRLLVSPSLDVGKLKELAKELGLDQKKFDACVDSGSKRAAVDSDAQEGRLAGVSGTPAFFINGIPLSGAQPAAAFEKIIDEELARKARQTTASR